MKYLKSLGLTSLILLYSAASWAMEPTAISDRIGSDIDSLEIAYFGLFPQVDSVVRARTLLMSNNDIYVVLTSKRKGVEEDSAFTINVHAAALLKEYIERYETTDRDIAYDAGKVFYLAKRTYHFRRIDEDYRLITAAGDSTEGFILSCIEDSLLFWKGSGVFTWSQTSENLRWYSFSEISRLLVKHNVDKTAWTLGAGFVGGLVGVGVYNAVNPGKSNSATNGDEAIIIGFASAAAGAVIGYVFSNDASDWKVNYDATKNNPLILYEKFHGKGMFTETFPLESLR